MNNKILVTQEDLGNSRTKKWLLLAVERGIFPLKASPELAQVCGHLIGDGSLRISKCGGGYVRFYGQKPKLEKIAKIYETLFHKKIGLTERDKHSGPGYKIDVTDTILAKCLNKIGVPSGDKVLTKFGVPFWILEGEREEKRKFLQALFDDEMECLYKDKKCLHTWKGLRLKMNKSEDLISAGLEFFRQLICLLKEFSIETTIAKAYDRVSYIRPNGIKTYTIVFRVRNNIENRRRFFKEIGFIYDSRKQQKLVDSLA